MWFYFFENSKILFGRFVLQTHTTFKKAVESIGKTLITGNINDEVYQKTQAKREEKAGCRREKTYLYLVHF
mgnify:FL=1